MHIKRFELYKIVANPPVLYFYQYGFNLFFTLLMSTNVFFTYLTSTYGHMTLFTSYDIYIKQIILYILTISNNITWLLKIGFKFTRHGVNLSVLNFINLELKIKLLSDNHIDTMRSNCTKNITACFKILSVTVHCVCVNQTCWT